MTRESWPVWYGWYLLLVVALRLPVKAIKHAGDWRGQTKTTVSPEPKGMKQGSQGRAAWTTTRTLRVQQRESNDWAPGCCRARRLMVGLSTPNSLDKGGADLQLILTGSRGGHPWQGDRRFAQSRLDMLQMPICALALWIGTMVDGSKALAANGESIGWNGSVRGGKQRGERLRFCFQSKPAQASG